MAYKIVMVLLGLLLSYKLNAAFFDQHAEGWHWYQDHLRAKEEILPKTPNKKTTALLTPTEIINAYKQELEQKLHLALVYPTPNNIKAYQIMQNNLLQQSYDFAKTWMQVIYQHPKLDHTLVAPVNQKARHIYLDQEKAKAKELMLQLKERYGLFYFFSSSCAYCHQFAPIVQQFAAKYAWEVIAISLDGGQLPGFKTILPDNGLSSQWPIKALPALFAVDPQQEQFVPIAYGLTSLDQIEERIMTLLEKS